MIRVAHFDTTRQFPLVSVSLRCSHYSKHRHHRASPKLETFVLTYMLSSLVDKKYSEEYSVI